MQAIDYRWFERPGFAIKFLVLALIYFTAAFEIIAHTLVQNSNLFGLDNNSGFFFILVDILS